MNCADTETQSPKRCWKYAPKPFAEGVIVFVAFSSLALDLILLFFLLGPPFGHSYRLDVLWSQAFAEQFFAGDFYPRWLFEPNAGAGSPAFYFYAPFPFWISAIFGKLTCLGCGAERWFIIGPVLLVALSGMSFYYWARLYARPLMAIVTAYLYVFLPYHFHIDLWARLTLGEIAAYVWLPIILWGLAKASTSLGYSIVAAAGYAGLLYSHLPSALLFSPIMAMFVAFQIKFVRGLLVLAIAVVLGIGFAAPYLVPALTTQANINSSAWWMGPNFDARNWLWLDGRSAFDFADIVLPALLMATCYAVIPTIGLLTRTNKRNSLTIFIVLSLIYAWFLMTAPSSFLWEKMWFLRKVQFPWRVGIVLDICASTMMAVWLDWSSDRKRLFFATLCLGGLTLGAYYGYNAGHMYSTLLATQEATVVAKLKKQLELGLDAREYQTSWTVRASQLSRSVLVERLDKMPDAELVSGAGVITIDRLELDRLYLTVEARSSVTVRFRRFYYPGWYLTGEQGGEAFAISASEVLGLVEARIPKGTRKLVLRRQPIHEERVGEMIWIATVFVVSLMLLGIWLRRRQPQHASRPARAGQ